MRKLRKINIDLSISRRWLSFDENWLDKLNSFLLILFFSQLIFFAVMLFFYENFVSPNEILTRYFVIPTSIVIGLYGIFRTITEKRLIKIETTQDIQTIKKIILDYAEKNQLEIYRNSKNYIILNSPSYKNFETSHKKSRIFFFNNGLLLFTVIRDNFKVNLPVFFTHFFIKRELAKLLNNSCKIS